MPFIKPMLAGPLSDKVTIGPGTHVAEEKYDGHRLIVEVDDAGLGDGIKLIKTWSRDGRFRTIPKVLTAALAKLPFGVYDGELIATSSGKSNTVGKSYGVTVVGADLKYVVFDVLELLGQDVKTERWRHRRKLLEQVFFAGPIVGERDRVQLSEVIHVNSRAEINTLAYHVWTQKKEGLIIKDVNALYYPGKRGTQFMKVKQLGSAVLEVIGFERGKGTVIDRGPYAVVLLKDSEGNKTKVKTLNDHELSNFRKQGENLDFGLHPLNFHPAIGRKLRIEFQERTPDGSYRHPRWDRWEDE